MNKPLVFPPEGHIGTKRHFLSNTDRRVRLHSDCDVATLFVGRHELDITSEALADLLAYVETNTLAVGIEPLTDLVLWSPEQIKDLALFILIDSYASIMDYHFNEDSISLSHNLSFLDSDRDSAFLLELKCIRQHVEKNDLECSLVKVKLSAFLC